MTDQPKSIWKRDLLPDAPIFKWPRRFLRWLFSWRGVRRMLILLAWTVTLIALLYGLENWRARSAWNNYRRDLEARGVQLDYKALIPKPVPDDRNFAATPVVRSWFDPKNQMFLDDPYSHAGRGRLHSSYREENKGNWRFLDLVPWAMAFDAIKSGDYSSGRKFREFRSDTFSLESQVKAAPSILEGLKTNEAVFAELRAAASRPESRYPIDYALDDPWAIRLPHLSKIQGTCRRLQLKACAELFAGRSDNALSDVKLILDLTDSLKDEPFLISHLVRAAWVRIAAQPVWEGLARHQWSDAQLREIQNRFQRYDALAGLKHGLDAERAAAVLTADLLAQRKYRLSHLSGELGGTDPSLIHRAHLADFVARLAPRGWFRREALNYCRLSELQFGGTFDAGKKRIWPGQVKTNYHAMEQTLAGRHPLSTLLKHQMVAALLLPGMGRIPNEAQTGTASAQAVADQVVLACALERFRLAHGRFPERLEELAPQFITTLPTDAITGEPYKYRRMANDQFVLYSVGWDEKDDGGVPGKRLFDETGDWVWQYPAK